MSLFPQHPLLQSSLFHSQNPFRGISSGWIVVGLGSTRIESHLLNIAKVVLKHHHTPPLSVLWKLDQHTSRQAYVVACNQNKCPIPLGPVLTPISLYPLCLRRVLIVSSGVVAMACLPNAWFADKRITHTSLSSPGIASSPADQPALEQD